jgi:nitrogen fixation NifU-like protein
MEEKAFTYEAEPELTEDHRELYFGRGIKLRPLRYNTRLLGRMENPSGYGKVTGTCGKSLEIYLNIQEKRIEDAMFFTDDSPTTRRCGSAVAELCTGRALEEAALIGGDTILTLLRGLPKGKVHCAFLAAEALHAALDDWMRRLPSVGKPKGPRHRAAMSGEADFRADDHPLR